MKLTPFKIGLILAGLIIWSHFCAYEEERLNYVALEHNQIKIINNQKEIIKMIKAAHPHHKKIRMHLITK